MAETREEAEYHSKDFSWDDLKTTVENDPSLHYHLTPLPTATAPPPPAAADAWRSFHRRHSSGKFFKERRYLLKEFPELVSCDDSAKVLEVGCGNGSTVLPILRSKQSTVVYACDCSEEILERAKGMISTSNVTSPEQRFHPFLHDFSVSEFPNWLFCANCRRISSSKKLNCLSDAKESVTKSTHLSHLEGPQCCIGGVDFVTLVLRNNGRYVRPRMISLTDKSGFMLLHWSLSPIVEIICITLILSRHCLGVRGDIHFVSSPITENDIRHSRMLLCFEAGLLASFPGLRYL